MLHRALIVIAIVVTTFGSLGLPLYLHSCRMVSMEQEAGCPMCASRESNIPTQHDTDTDGEGCCSDSVVNQRVDPGTTYRADVPVPPLVDVIVLVSFELTIPHAPCFDTGARGHSPPGLAARAQHTYLNNASFLI